jgi:hypothetical protein
MFQTKVVEKIKTHILCSITLLLLLFIYLFLFYFENRTVYELMWNNNEAPRHVPIWCMSFACWITKATNTQQEDMVLTAFPLPQWLCERVSVLCLYIHCLSCLFCRYYSYFLDLCLILSAVRAVCNISSALSVAFGLKILR